MFTRAVAALAIKLDLVQESIKAEAEYIKQVAHLEVTKAGLQVSIKQEETQELTSQLPSKALPINPINLDIVPIKAIHLKPGQVPLQGKLKEPLEQDQQVNTVQVQLTATRKNDQQSYIYHNNPNKIT